MEKILNEDERLRRAEEIYLKRNNRNINLLRDGESKTKRYLGSKVLLYLVVLFNIAVLIFCLQNKEYIFTEEFLKECNEYNINISQKVNGLIENFLVDEKTEENTIQNVTNETIYSDNVVSENQLQEQTKGSSDVSNTNQEISTEEKVESSLSEMDLDIENLKKIYKFVKPLDAMISSSFGARESEYQNVTGYHTGIDLAAEKGTSIKAAMEGIVTLVSDEGDYRKTCKN